MDIILNHKEFNDPIHGFIKVSNIACRIIDTMEFQRLRYLHQLGTCHYVFPSATHTRFEHSIGTYYLTDKVLDRLKTNTTIDIINNCMEEIPELKEYYINTYKDQPHNKLDIYVCELIKIAGLCHDLGHGPFSHVFDDIFIKKITDGKKKSYFDEHENRSCYILEHIINKDEILKNTIKPSHIKLIQNLINPPKNITGFIYQIVSNSLNSIDVDKFDYIARDTHTIGLKYGFDHFRIINDMKVIDNKICFPKKVYYEVISLFKTRYRLHKQIYCHKAVLSLQFMINDIMLLINEICNIYDSIHDITKFIHLTDEFIISKLKFLYENKNLYDNDKIKIIDKAYDLWDKINRRQLYKLIIAETSNTSKKFSFPKIKELDPDIDTEKIIVYKSKIGFVSGSKKNPLNEIYLYDKNIPESCSKIDKINMSFEIPKLYQEHIYMFFLRDKYDADTYNRFKKIYFNLFD